MKVIKCEVFTRVVGYFRPVQQFNEGKKQEFFERRAYCEKEFKSHEKFNNEAPVMVQVPAN